MDWGKRVASKMHVLCTVEGGGIYMYFLSYIMCIVLKGLESDPPPSKMLRAHPHMQGT